MLTAEERLRLGLSAEPAAEALEPEDAEFRATWAFIEDVAATVSARRRRMSEE